MATMKVTDDVERPAHVGLVAGKPLLLDDSLIQLRPAREEIDPMESFHSKSRLAFLQQLGLGSGIQTGDIRVIGLPPS